MTGMVSPEIEAQFIERGVYPISPPDGRRMFAEELRWGQRGEVEVVVGEGPWRAMEVTHSSGLENGFPMLGGSTVRERSNGSLELVRTLDASLDTYLKDHLFDQKPVLPAAMAMELMAEVVQQGWRTWEIVSIHNFRVLRGVVLENGPREILVSARAKPGSAADDDGQEVEVKITTVDFPDQPCYRATVKVGKRISVQGGSAFQPSSDLRPFPLTVEEAYQKVLFHGPSLQTITSIEGISEEGISSVMRPSSPAQCFRQRNDGQWLIDPVLLDGAFQLAVLWGRQRYDMTALPAAFSSFHRFSSIPRSPVRCYLQVKPGGDGHVFKADVHFLDDDGQMISTIQDAEFSCSKALNRLAGTAAQRGETSQ
jgi:hypothetical protein